MKKLILLMVVAVVAALCCTSCAPQAEVQAAPEEVRGDASAYARVVIPKAHISSAIQPIQRLSDESWEEPNHETAWILVPWPQAIYIHRVLLGSELGRLKPSDVIFLHRDWGAEDEPLQLRVEKSEIIDAEDEDTKVQDQVGGDMFAIITCHPPDDPEVPQRLIVWASIDRGQRWVYFDWGGSLQKIAQRYGVTPEAILQENNFTTEDVVPEMWLRIPEE